MRDITEWALATACSSVATTAPPGWTLSVNVTAADAASKDLLRLVAAALESSALPPERLVLEITETGLLRGHSEAAVVLGQLRDLGVGVALDDFGTGFSSLSLLRQLPISELKVDGTFVANVETSALDAAIVTNVVRLADAFGASVVAEGVESQSQAKLLAQLGCEFAQGYLWSRAAPLDELIDLVPEVLFGRAGWRPAPVLTNRILRMASEGASSASIAAALNADGITTPDDKHWHNRSVSRLLHRLEREASTPEER
jgi:EAL domain-containing protein (putative c-di-GMP-specific phosphodiesterase class I)